MLGEIDGAMLPAGAAERNHEVLEPAIPIVANAGVHQGRGVGEKLMDALVLIQVVNHRRVLAAECLEAFFPSGIGNGSAVEDKSAAVSSFVLRHASPMK